MSDEQQRQAPQQAQPEEWGARRLPAACNAGPGRANADGVNRPLGGGAAMEELALGLPEGALALLGPVADHPLPAAEAACLVGASTARRRQFATGRHLARTALGRLRGGDGFILRQGRRPIWPKGFVGSISHTKSLAAAAVAQAGALRGLGLDIERTDRLKAGLHPKVLTSRERRRPWLDAREGVVAFSAKEAGYKAVNPLTGLYIGFQEVEVLLDWSSAAFRLRYLGRHEANRMLDAGVGGFRVRGDHVITIFRID